MNPASKNDCPHCGTRQENGNCPEPLDDGHAVQCVGGWAQWKHHYLSQYIDATWRTRVKYLPPNGTGGAAYIDLFAGPGRARIRDTGEVIDGSPLIAMSHEKAPFSKILLCDLESDNVTALKERSRRYGDRAEVFSLDSNAETSAIINAIPNLGLNLALVDPFRPRDLKWTTIEKLANLQRMDLIINFATGFIRRNLFDSPGYDRVVDEMLPSDSAWRTAVRSTKEVSRLIEYFRNGLIDLGYDESCVRCIPVTNRRNVVLYHLVFASKRDLGTRIWNSIARSDPTGQRDFGF